MTNFILKVKINNYFPKLETIPYNNFICLMICNNYFSEIKLSEIKSKIYSYTSKSMNNSDLLLKIKLIDYVQNYSLVGVYDLVIPYLNIIKMFNKIYTSYNKQIMLKMSNNYNFNICLDLTIEVSTLEANTSIFIKEINYKTFDYKKSNSNKPMREALKLNYNQKNLKFKIKKFAISKRNNKDNEIYGPSFNRNNSNYNNVKVNNYLNIFRTESKADKYININNRSPNNLYSKFKNVINSDNNHKRKITDFNLYDKLNKNNNNINNILKSPAFLKSSENFYSASKTQKDLKNNINSIRRDWINKSPDESNILNKKNKDIKINNFENNSLESKDMSEISYLNPDNERNTLNNIKSKKYVYSKKYFTKNSKETNKSSTPINTINNYSDKRTNYIFNKSHIYSKKYSDSTFSTKSKKLIHPKEISSVLNHFNHIKSHMRHKIAEKTNMTNISQKIHHKKDDFIKYADNCMRSQNQTETSSEMKNALNDGGETLNINQNQSESGVNDVNSNEIISDLNQNDIKDKIIKQIDVMGSLKKEIEQKIKDNKNLIPKYFLYKEKYNSELKRNYCLEDEKNLKEIKSIIHVNINSKLNEQFYLKMKGIKNKEMEVIENIFRENKKNMLKKNVKKKLEQQKQIHALLKIIRELVKNYENLSQLYNDNEHKKILFKSLLVRYGIREKEEKIDFNFIDKYNELKRNADNEKNKLKKNEVEKDIYKNIINEEDSEESRSSISGRKSKNNILKKLSWCSEDSVIKERLDFEDIQKNNISPNIMSNPDSKRKELLIEDNNSQNDININDKADS